MLHKGCRGAIPTFLRFVLHFSGFPLHFSGVIHRQQIYGLGLFLHVMSPRRNHRKVVGMKNKTDLKTAVPDRYVTLSNVLVRAAQGLTLAEKRIMSACIAQLDSKRMPDMYKPLTVKLYAMDFAETFGIHPDTAYDELQSAAKVLRDRLIRYENPSAPKSRRVVEMRWVGRVTYAKGEGWLELAFWHEVVPHLVMLREKFTSYRLSQAAGLRSLYSWRLLELLMQFRSTGFLHITIENFWTAVEAPASCRNDFFNLRKRVIEPAVKELGDKDGLIIEWKPIKEGRKVTALMFLFEPSKQGALDLSDSGPESLEYVSE